MNQVPSAARTTGDSTSLTARRWAFGPLVALLAPVRNRDVGEPVHPHPAQPSRAWRAQLPHRHIPQRDLGGNLPARP